MYACIGMMLNERRVDKEADDSIASEKYFSMSPITARCSVTENFIVLYH